MSKKLVLCGLALVIACLSFGVVSAQEVTEPPPLEPGNALEAVTGDAAAYYSQTVTFEGVIYELLNVRTFVLGEGAALDDDQVLVINNTGQEFDLNVRRDQRVQVTGTVWPSIVEGGLFQIQSGVLAIVEPTSEDITTTGQDAALPTEEMMPTEEAMPTTEPGAAATEEMMPTEEAMATAEPGAVATEEMMPTEEAMATAEPDMGAETDMTDTAAPAFDLTSMVLPDEFNNYTIIVLNSLDDITFVEPPTQ